MSLVFVGTAASEDGFIDVGVLSVLLLDTVASENP